MKSVEEIVEDAKLAATYFRSLTIMGVPDPVALHLTLAYVKCEPRPVALEGVTTKAWKLA